MNVKQTMEIVSTLVLILNLASIAPVIMDTTSQMKYFAQVMILFSIPFLIQFITNVHY